MPVLMRLITRLSSVTGLVLVGLAIWQWVWYAQLPPHASARWCGNCYLGAVGIPTEIALLGLLLIVHAAAEIPHECKLDWALAIIGIFLTPYLIGLPFFAGAFLMLA